MEFIIHAPSQSAGAAWDSKPVAGNATLIADQSLIVANYGVKWRMQKGKTEPKRRLTDNHSSERPKKKESFD